jgi:eukaryotic-like serine/threonine-protein kinase
MGPRHVDASPARPMIGPYKLLQVIGEGGFGVVHMAEQLHPVHRQVALKLIKPGMDSVSVIARFEAERQALAMMSHVNIAKVLDAGNTRTGLPYFVMELVRGVPITHYCDQNRLTIPQRLELFAQVCKAVQHAHQKAVIHRDIKPGNVLVTVQEDGTPVPKVIDFGVAKALQSRLTDHTVVTELRHFIGTPEYMSPEQAEGSLGDVDTRTDVYSLGVLLYELLTGVTPFDARELRGKTYGELQRIIREVEPARPSTRLGTLPADVLEALATGRRLDPKRLGKVVCGDLDWIVMKCLEKDRTRRYASAITLADDLRRYLSHQPVEAGPPSNVYRFQKMMRRNRGVFAAVAAVATVLLAGVVVSTVLYVRQSNALRRALAAERRQKQLALDADVARQAESAERSKAQKAAADADNRAREARASAYQAMLFAADGAVRLNDTELARRRLDSTPQSLRSWEWRWLSAQADNSLVHLPLPRGNYYPRSVHFDAATGTVIATGMGSITEYQPSGWRVLATHRIDQLIPGWYSAREAEDGRRSAPPSVLGVHADSRRAVVGDDLGGRTPELITWSRPELGTVTLENASPRSLRAVFSPDGRLVTLLTTGRRDAQTTTDVERTLVVHDASTGKIVATLPTMPRNLYAAQFSPDGRIIAIGTSPPGRRPRDKHFPCLHLFETRTAQPLFTGADDAHVFDIVFSSDGKTLFASGFDQTRIIDTEKKVERGSIPQGGMIAADPDGKLLAVASEAGGVITVFDVSTARPRHLLLGSPSVASLTFSSDARFLMASDDRGIIRVWDLQRSPWRRTLPAAGAPQVFGSLGGDTPAFLSLNLNVGSGQGRWGVLEIGDPSSGVVKRLSVAAVKPTAAALAPKTSVVALGRRDGHVELRDARTAALIREFPAHAADISSLRFAKDETSLAVGSSDGEVSIRNVADGSILAQLRKPDHAAPNPDQTPVFGPGGPGAISFLEFAPDGDLLFIVDSHSIVRGTTHFMSGIPGIWAVRRSAPARLWQWLSQDTPHPLVNLVKPGPEPLGLVFDRRRVLAYLSDGTLLCLDADTGSPISRTKIGASRSYWSQGIQRLALSPDGQRLAVLPDGDRTLRILEAQSLQELLTVSVGAGRAETIAWSADGKSIAIGGADSSAGDIELLDTSALEAREKDSPQ